MNKIFLFIVSKYLYDIIKRPVNKKVLIKGCASAPVPTWAYLIIATYLSQHAKTIYYGESCNLITIFQK